MKAEFIKKEVYGNIRFYPRGETANLFCELIGQRTFTEKQLELLKKTGVIVVILNDY